MAHLTPRLISRLRYSQVDVKKTCYVARGGSGKGEREGERKEEVGEREKRARKGGRKIGRHW